MGAGHPALQFLVPRRERARRSRFEAEWLPGRGGLARKTAKQIQLRFYVPGDEASRASLTAHIGELDWVVPGLISIAGPDLKLTLFSHLRLDSLLARTPKPPLVVSL